MIHSVLCYCQLLTCYNIHYPLTIMLKLVMLVAVFGLHIMYAHPYTEDIITEQAILKWYNDSHLSKGKSVFLSQMKPMVDWLLTAEEESDSETKDSQTLMT